MAEESNILSLKNFCLSKIFISLYPLNNSETKAKIFLDEKLNSFPIEINFFLYKRSKIKNEIVKIIKVVITTLNEIIDKKIIIMINIIASLKILRKDSKAVTKV